MRDEEDMERELAESRDFVLKRRVEREGNPKEPGSIAFELSCVPLKK